MKILVVDDGQLAINSLIRILCRVAPDCDYISAMTTEDALSWMRQGPMDAAFLNLEMPGMNGLALTRMIQKLQPRCNIIVVTEHPEYALEALQIFVSGFLLKPANEADVRNVLEHLRYPPENAPVGIKIQCFGNFEIFVGGRALAFKRSKSKELLAYLVDRNGATCTNGEKLTAQITAALGEGAKLEDVDAAEPFYIEADSPAIRACIDTYNEVTGENATPFTMGGGTYARHFSYAVSFGPEHEDVKLPEFGGPMHGANEAAPIDKLLEAVKIYILALLRLEEIDF